MGCQWGDQWIDGGGPCRTPAGSGGPWDLLLREQENQVPSSAESSESAAPSLAGPAGWPLHWTRKPAGTPVPRKGSLELPSVGFSKLP